VPRAIAVGEELAASHPLELATAKATQYHYFNLGDAAGMLRISQKIGRANADLPYAHGMAAFAYEQAHLLEDAEASARRAIGLRRKEPWAQHALSHVFLAQGRTGEARGFLEDVKETWTDLNSFMFSHNWWHMALVMIDQGDIDAILGFYDRNIWGLWKEYSQDQIGAVSLLARLELVGVDVGDRWADLGEHLKARVDDHVQPFLSAQYLYGLARAGLPEADATMAAIRAHAAEAPAFMRAAWTEVAVPLCEALLAHARGDHETAVRRLGPVLPRLAEIGGSHAQRDLFDQVWLDALIRTGRLGAAQRILEQRREARPEAKTAYGKLALVYDRLDLPEEAGRIMVRARAAALAH
jgi:tetratricopeptide (TPR) repeat protein